MLRGHCAYSNSHWNGFLFQRRAIWCYIRVCWRCLGEIPHTSYFHTRFLSRLKITLSCGKLTDVAFNLLAISQPILDQVCENVCVEVCVGGRVGGGWTVIIFALRNFKHVFPASVLTTCAQKQRDPVGYENRWIFLNMSSTQVTYSGSFSTPRLCNPVLNMFSPLIPLCTMAGKSMPLRMWALWGAFIWYNSHYEN